MNEFEGLSREELVAIILEQRDAILALREEVEDLRSQIGGGRWSPPPWVKANRPEKEKKDRKKRKKSFFRVRETPSEAVEHALDTCPDCGRQLAGGTVKWKRQVIDIPIVAVQVREHRFISRYCGVCGKRFTPKADLSHEVLGSHRVGIRLMSLVAYLAIKGRMTKRTIQSFLRAVYGLHLGLGEITKILHTVAECGREEKERLLALVRGSPYINADETGWREDGLNGYIWTFSTKDVRYFAFRKSRSGEVAKEAIGDEYLGTVVTDRYAAYNALLAERQICWAHLLRDLTKLSERNPDDVEAASFAEAIKGLYLRAKAVKSESPQVRRSSRILLEQELQRLVMPYIERECPQRALAYWLSEHISEIFVFVEDPRVPSDNNGAERSLRPAVIARKVCGGTRSERGSETKMTLMSLFGTWSIRNLDPMEACRQLLMGKSVLFPAPT
ncbi:MAG: IS66 family transposase [Armatimonadetes bacterium]|nr:IS66 family transposase [Armatimonadota bacterium]NIO97765.1 IS66 family transposase [Armatimonadota bacterium]